MRMNIRRMQPSAGEVQTTPGRPPGVVENGCRDLQTARMLRSGWVPLNTLHTVLMHLNTLFRPLLKVQDGVGTPFPPPEVFETRVLSQCELTTGTG